KSTNAYGISINNATSALAFCQYFDGPQDITVYGASFVAYKPDNSNGNSINVTVAVYNATVDSLPLGSPLASGTVAVDTIVYSYNIDSLRRTVIFSNPVTLT